MITAVIGYTTEFCVKQRFCFHALNPIRNELKDILTKFLQKNHSPLTARLLATQAANSIALPVTVFCGDIVGEVANHISQKVISLFSKIILGVKKAKAPLKTYIIPKIAAWATGYFAKTYFCYHSLDTVCNVLAFILKKGATTYFGHFLGGILAGQAAKTFAFSVTLFLSDGVGFSVRKASNYCYNRIWEVLFPVKAVYNRIRIEDVKREK